MSVAPMDISPDLKRAGRRMGYAVAVAINLVALVVVQNILDWGWLPFLTVEFVEVVPWISFSLVLSIVANLIYEFNDTPVVKSMGQILINLVSIFVTYQVWQVFPFDFSAYQFDWDLVTRVVLVLAMVGAGIGVFAEAAKLASSEQGTRKEVRDVHSTRVDT